MKLNKDLKRVIYIILAIIIGIQLIPYGWTKSNPPIVDEPAWDSPDTRQVFMKACGDCHSNETKYPWYSYVAPVSWLVQTDVDKGRADFNISEWNRKHNEGDEAAREFRKGSMPPKIFMITHSDANLKGIERDKFLQGLIATFGDKNENHEK